TRLGLGKARRTTSPTQHHVHDLDPAAPGPDAERRRRHPRARRLTGPTCVRFREPIGSGLGAAIGRQMQSDAAIVAGSTGPPSSSSSSQVRSGNPNWSLCAADTANTYESIGIHSRRYAHYYGKTFAVPLALKPRIHVSVHRIGR